MPKFIVHLCPVIRVKIKQEIEAANYEEAVDKALKLVDIRGMFDEETDEHVIEDNECMPYALVDVPGDEDFEKSRWVHLDVGISWGPQLLAQFQSLVAHAQSDYWANANRFTPVMPQWLSDAVDLNTQIEDDLKAQKAPPEEPNG